MRELNSKSAPGVINETHETVPGQFKEELNGE